MGLVGKFFSVGSATLASRILGFVREAMIAGFLGAGPVADAFYAAFRFPNLFRRIFAEGAFNAAFVPLFAERVEKGGDEDARRFAGEVMSALIFILVGLSALAMIFMPLLTATVIAPKFADTPDKFDLTVLLTRIMFPFLACMSVVAMLAGILNTFRSYFLPSLVPVVLNVVLISVLLVWGAGGAEDRALGIAMAWGVFVSGIVQAALLAVAVRRRGFSFTLPRPRLTQPVRQLVILAFPGAIAAGIAQINLLVGQIIASAQDGAIAIVNYADRLVQLPLGLIAVSIGVVLLPELSRALSSGDAAEASKLQNRSVEFGLALMMPAAAGLYVMAEPLVALVYERGAFGRETTLITGSALAAFALGLPAVVLTKIFQPAFYARKDTRTPMWFAGANATTNIVLAVLLFPEHGVTGLGYAFSAASWVNAILLAGTLLADGRFLPDPRLLRNCLIVMAASAVMAAGLLWARWQFDTAMLSDGELTRITSILPVVAAAMAVYFSAIIATGVVPLSDLKRLAGRRRAGKG